MFLRSLFILSACLGFIAPINAALPPYYQGVKELSTILNDKRLAEAIGSGDFITSISKNDTGYEITTHRCTLQVDVVNQPQQMPGPVPFELNFHTPECK